MTRQLNLTLEGCEYVENGQVRECPYLDEGIDEMGDFGDRCTHPDSKNTLTCKAAIWTNCPLPEIETRTCDSCRYNSNGYATVPQCSNCTFQHKENWEAR